MCAQGIGGRGGGLSEYICVDRRLVFPLPPKVPRKCHIYRKGMLCRGRILIDAPVDVGAMMEPLSIAWHAVKRSNFKAGDTVLILGAGPVRHASALYIYRHLSYSRPG